MFLVRERGTWPIAPFHCAAVSADAPLSFNELQPGVTQFSPYARSGPDTKQTSDAIPTRMLNV